MRYFALLSITLGLLCWPVRALAADSPAAEQIEFFETRIRPLLAEHCHECHSGAAEEPEGGLRLDSHAAVLKGGDSGQIVTAGKPDESLLIQAVHYRSVEMPPSGKLKPDEIKALEEWVTLGLPWPQEESSVATDEHVYDWGTLQSEHWAWQPVVAPPSPAVNRTDWARSDLDRFVLARLEAAGLTPAPQADRRSLIRRAYFDLIGLPPAPTDVAAFLHDRRPLAFARLVDRLLASKHYGERWGRHWLDVARYADDLPHAWRYRDWVVEALNRDLPYDHFVQAQIAGDLIGGDQAAVATGFFALGPSYNSDGGDPDGVAAAKSATLDDRVDTFSRGLLGLTVACARCHDHKFDPIPTQDYYSLAGVFNNTANTDGKSGLHALHETGSADMQVALRGNLRKPGPVAPRRFLRILTAADPPRFTSGSGRQELAAAVAHPCNPLTARVIVNRVWRQHLGQAIVRTPSNFGMLGRAPTHPLLLDWLAARLMESGWSLKDLHRTIMLSATYQMSSRIDEQGQRLDGDNELLWRFNPRKLDAEAWRDGLLAVTGELDTALGGGPRDTLLDSHRRTLYSKVSRNGDQFEADEFLRTFDFPSPRATSAQRTTSIIPQQYLFMLNSDFMRQRAAALAQRLNYDASDDPSRIDQAYALVFGRAPSEQEKQLAIRFLQVDSAGAAEPIPSRWQQYAQVLLSSNEFMYVR